MEGLGHAVADVVADQVTAEKEREHHAHAGQHDVQQQGAAARCRLQKGLDPVDQALEQDCRQARKGAHYQAESQQQPPFRHLLQGVAQTETAIRHYVVNFCHAKGKITK